MKRHALQLEYFISKLNVKEYERQEFHYQEKNKNIGIA